jgi:hypothetical protein
MTSPLETTRAKVNEFSQQFSAPQVRDAVRWVAEFYGTAPQITALRPDLTKQAKAVLGESLFADIRSLAEQSLSPAPQAAVEPPSAPEPTQPRPEAILGDTEQLMRQAIGDPGIWVRRLPGELVTYWAARAVMAALGFDDKRVEVEWGYITPDTDGEFYIQCRDEDSARDAIGRALSQKRVLAQRIIGAVRKVIS